MTRAQVITFGCRLNAYESQVIRDHADAGGMENTVIFNTCAVTAEAQRQARQSIRKTRRENPQARIIVTGCAAQIEPQHFAQMDEVDLVLGNEEKMQAQSFLAPDFGIAEQEKIRVNDIMTVRESAHHMIDGYSERSRAFVQVQNGCDHRCTFCIIPFGRGNSRSVPAGEVVAQIRRLVETGYNEIVLSGVDITSYGADLPGQPKLGDLVLQVLKLVPELPRLRLSSIDSIEADSALMRAFAEHERLMPHVHLSLQAGDDMILKRMKRRHNRRDAIAFCDELRMLRPDVVFGADIIAGFPTETDEMFANSVQLVAECDLTFLHVFPYSARPGTPAARMPQLNGKIIRQRARVLRDAGEQRLAAFLKQQIGSEQEVLVESDNLARTRHYVSLRHDNMGIPGTIVSAIVTDAGNDYVEGKRAV